jgi:hypothetical protein
MWKHLHGDRSQIPAKCTNAELTAWPQTLTPLDPNHSLICISRHLSHHCQNWHSVFLHRTDTALIQSCMIDIVYYTRSTSKVKLPCTCHAGSKGRGGTARTHSWPRHWMGVSGQHRAAFTVFYPQGRDPQNPLDRRLGEPQSFSGHRG